MEKRKINWAAMPHGEFTRRYIERFRPMFSHMNDMQQSLIGFGLDFDAGWHKLVWDLTLNIEKELTANPIEGFEIVQEKEKFGGLRYYIYSGNDKIFKLIERAENESYKTCERCGKAGSLDKNFSWYKTLCKKCKIKRAKEREAENKRIHQLSSEAGRIGKNTEILRKALQTADDNDERQKYRKAKK